MGKRKIIYDCDPGTDDSVAILMAIMSPEIELLAITTESGNFPSSVSANHALKILEYIGRIDIPVYKGMEHPLVREYPSDPYSHGQDGLGNHFFPEPQIGVKDKHAALAIIDYVRKYPGEVTLICSAPLTNIALAFMLDPGIIPMIDKVYHLGGAYGFSDYAFMNATGDNPMSEWNIYVDPEAAATVYGSGVDLIAIGLDVAFNPKLVNIESWAICEIEAIGNKASRYALEIIEYIDKNNTIKEKGLFINGPIDTTLMCSFLNPNLIEKKQICVQIDTSDNKLTRGMTIWDRREHFQWENLSEITVATTIDPIEYQKTFIKALKG